VQPVRLLARRPGGRRPRDAATAGLALLLLLLAAPAASAEGTDPQAPRPLLLEPARPPSGPGEAHRAETYRFGLERSLRVLESQRQTPRDRPGLRQDPHGRLGVQSRIHDARRELSRINRGLKPPAR